MSSRLGCNSTIRARTVYTLDDVRSILTRCWTPRDRLPCNLPIKPFRRGQAEVAVSTAHKAATGGSMVMLIVMLTRKAENLTLSDVVVTAAPLSWRFSTRSC